VTLAELSQALTLLTTAGALVYFAATLKAEVRQLSRARDDHETRIRGLERGAPISVDRF
jgi:hypothetical protein